MKAQGLHSLTETTDARRKSIEHTLMMTKSHNSDFNKMFEDQYVLAFRQYTRGIIAYNLFIQEIESTKHVIGDNGESTKKKLSKQCIRYAVDAL